MRQLFIILITVLAFVLPARAAERIALVIGNSNYQFVTKLNNPKNDAEKIADNLEQMGFEVFRKFDLNLKDTSTALREFRIAADSAQLALVYYAGHAFQMDGINYVAAIDSEIIDPREVPDQTVELSRIMQSAEGARDVVVFIDACRNNPFKASIKKNDLSRGVLDSDLPRGLNSLSFDLNVQGSKFVGMAAELGETALDGKDANSPFAVALLQHMKEPITVAQMFTRVTNSVLQATGNAQRPHIFETSMVTDICLPGSCSSQAGIEEKADTVFAFIKDTGNVEQLTGFISQYQGTSASRLGEELLKKLLSGKDASGSNEAELLLAKAETRFFSDQRDAETLKLFLASGEAGSPFGYIKAAHILLKGIGVPKDQDRARLLSRNIVSSVLDGQKSDIKAYYYSALAYNYGLGVPVDLERALKLAVKGADLGDPFAMNLAAVNFEDGEGTPVDFDRSEFYYTKATEKGDALAMLNFGDFYRDRKQNYAKAMFWYDRAAQANSSEAPAKIGYLYANGLGVPRDDVKANEYYAKSADRQVDFAYNNLGHAAQNGFGMPKDLKTAEEYYLQALAVSPDFENAITNLGGIYAEKDKFKAEKFYLEKIQQFPKLAFLQNAIGNLYSEKFDDQAKALFHHERARSMGSPDAIAYIAWMNHKGLGFPKDEKKAIQLYLEAGNQGVGWAFRNLFYLHNGEEGTKIKQDAVLAEKYIREAIALEPAQHEYLEALGDFLKDRKKDVAGAIAVYEAAGSQGSGASYFVLGDIHEFARGVKDTTDNKRKAADYYYKAMKSAIPRGKTKTDTWNKETARELQRLMSENGVYAGAIDGVFGAASQRAYLSIN